MTSKPGIVTVHVNPPPLIRLAGALRRPHRRETTDRGPGTVAGTGGGERIVTVTTIPRPKLRHRVDDNERVILAKVAATGQYGFMVERGQESKAEQILVEDGYLSCDVVPGMSRSYARFRLTETGRKALALKEAQS